jgi:L-ascorbate metabolism protein UlaG (beta-lactamase superfamily)
MKITKFGHACILVEVDGVKILLDPGDWNALPEMDSLDAILITHEHEDHFDIGQVKELVLTHPAVRIITHQVVGKILTESGITHELIESGESVDVNGVSVESCGTEHAVVYGSVPCRNTGFFIAGQLFVPGDALHDVPSKPVRVLALPTGGPWMKLSEAIDYTKLVKPEIVFPIHDAMYIEGYLKFVPAVMAGNLESTGIKFVDMVTGETKEF